MDAAHEHEILAPRIREAVGAAASRRRGYSPLLGAAIRGAAVPALTASQPQEFTLCLRIPGWASGARIEVNGQRQRTAAAHRALGDPTSREQYSTFLTLAG